MTRVLTPQSAFSRQKYHALQRGIPFEFDLETWVEWWVTNLGPDWLSKRGPRRGQYVMARNGDKGPYAPWNVQCKTSSDNHAEQYANGRAGSGWNRGIRGYPKKGNKLSAEQVLEIFRCTDPQNEVAARYGIGRQTIYKIKHGEIWGYLTEALRCAS